MHPTQLFVYGTLRHDQPEHAKYCRGVTSWRPARLRGELWSVPAGYRLVIVPAAAVLFEASTDAIADEIRRHALNMDVLALAACAQQNSSGPWTNGELLGFRDAAEAWPPIDRWEEFTPGGPRCYARVVIPVEIIDDGQPRVIAAWAYVATKAPAGSLQLTV